MISKIAQTFFKRHWFPVNKSVQKEMAKKVALWTGLPAIIRNHPIHVLPLGNGLPILAIKWGCPFDACRVSSLVAPDGWTSHEDVSISCCGIYFFLTKTIIVKKTTLLSLVPARERTSQLWYSSVSPLSVYRQIN